MGRSRSTSVTNQTSTTRLPDFQEGAVRNYFDEIRRIYGETGLRRTPYEGDLVADLTPDQIEGMNLARTFATGTGQNYANRVLDTSSYLLDPQNLLDPSRVPGFDASQDAIVRRLTQNLRENILPQTRGGQILSGAYGDSGSAISDALNTERTNQVIADQLSTNQMNTYFAGLQAMQNALQLAPQTAGVGLLPADVLGQVGALQQGQNQAEIDANVRRHEFEQNEPIEALARLQALVGTAGQYGGTVNTTGTTTTRSSPSALQTLATLGSLAAIPFTFGSSLAAIPAATGAAGAAGKVAAPKIDAFSKPMVSPGPSFSAAMPALQSLQIPGPADPNNPYQKYPLGRSLAPIRY